MDRDTALALLSAQCAADTYPTLTTDELGTILDATVDATTWQPDTTYIYGQKVRPTTRNGHLYQCIVAGTSDATEPSVWPAYTTPDPRPGVTVPHWYGFINPIPGFTQVGDGSVVWIECGFDGNTIYNLQDATYAAWLRKAAKASADYDVTVNAGSAFKRQQVVASCLAMAKQFRPTRIA
jgi:hypothetical protein